MNDDPLSSLARLSSTLFLPLRKLAGPFHRRRPSFDDGAERELPPLPPPWQDDRWFRGDFPPRAHNALAPLVDGERYFGDLCQTLLSARRRVTIAGWCLTPLMPLQRDGQQVGPTVADILHQVSVHAEVCVLLWSGAPALFEPTQRMVEEARQTLLQHAPAVRCELDHRAHFSHDHHQKAVTIDGRVAYVGGMDLSTFQGDRWDTHAHDLRFGPNWHDVQVRMEGEVVRDVEENFCQRWNAVTGENLEPLPPGPLDASWQTPAQIVRTVPAGFYPFAPDGIFGIYHALTSAIRQAKHFIYLENQYLWAPEIIDALVEALQRPHAGAFRVVVVLPAKAYTGKYDNDEHVRLLSKVDAGRGMFHAYSLYAGGPAIGATGHRYLPIYVHAKVSIVDDEWFSVGSANLNQRGLAGDTEMNIQSIAPDVARTLRVKLWSEHLGLPEEQVAAADPIELIDTQWQATAESMRMRSRSGLPPPGGTIRQYVPGHNPGSRLLDMIQDLTLEH